jgi:hypothetical protein
MIYLLLAAVLVSVLFIVIVKVEQNYISELEDSHKFKKWWRKNLIGEEE